MTYSKPFLKKEKKEQMDWEKEYSFGSNSNIGFFAYKKSDLAKGKAEYIPIGDFINQLLDEQRQRDVADIETKRIDLMKCPKVKKTYWNRFFGWNNAIDSVISLLKSKRSNFIQQGLPHYRHYNLQLRGGE